MKSVKIVTLTTFHQTIRVQLSSKKTSIKLQSNRLWQKGNFSAFLYRFQAVHLKESLYFVCFVIVLITHIVIDIIIILYFT